MIYTNRRTNPSTASLLAAAMVLAPLAFVVGQSLCVNLTFATAFPCSPLSFAQDDLVWQTYRIPPSQLDAIESLLNDLFGKQSDTTILSDRKRSELRVGTSASQQSQIERILQTTLAASDRSPGVMPGVSNLGGSGPSGSTFSGSTGLSGSRLPPVGSSNARLITPAAPLSPSLLSSGSSPEPANQPERERSLLMAPYQWPAYLDRMTALLGDKLQRESAQGAERYVLAIDAQRHVRWGYDATTNRLSLSGDPDLVQQVANLSSALLERASAPDYGVGMVRTRRADRGQLARVLEAYTGRSPQEKSLPSASERSRLPRIPSNASDTPFPSSTPPNAGGLSSESDRSSRTSPQTVSSAGLLRPIATSAGPRGREFQPASFLSPVIRQDLELPPGATFQDDSGTGSQENLPDFGRNIEVEFLPDLDVIILRGRNQDLEQLAQIIEELERLSEQTQPEVEIYPLQHVASEAMAALVAQVNDDLIQGRQGRISVTALGKPNALLMIGWGDAVTATKDLISKLDQPVEPTSQFQVYRLKFATAATLQTTLNTFIANRPGLGLRARITADLRTNSIIVNAAPRDFAEIEQLVSELDRPEGMATTRGQVIEAKHVLASDLAQTLQLALNAIQTGDSRSAILELLTIDETGAEVIRSGALDNVSVTAQPRTNSVLLTAPPESLPLLRSLLEQLDQPGSTAQMKIFKIQHSDAASIVQVLRSLLPSETSTTQPFRLPNSGLASSIVPLRFSIDTRTNSVLAIGNEADLTVVEALILRLDEQGDLDRKTVVYHLKNAPARDISAAINQFLLNQRQLSQASPGATNPYQQLEQEVIIVPEPVGNRLILSATSRYFEKVSELIEKLDEAPPQVMIQVLIAEVALNSADEFGIELGIQDTVLFDRSLLGDLLTTVNSTATSTPSGVVTITEEIIQAASNQPGFNFNSSGPLGNSGSNKALANSKATGGQGISNFSVGRINDELGYGGLVLSASGRNVSALLRALQESRRLEILSRPQIRSLDNQPAYIQVGQKVPRITGSVVNQNGQTNTVDLENVGLILGVTPRISPDGTVVMEVDAEKSQLGTELDGIPITVSNDGTIIRSPRIETTTAQTTVSAASGETIVLGGLISKSSQQVNRKVPWLGDLPLLGRLFRFDSDIGKRTELVIILTPHVIRSSEDSQRLKEIELARISWCAADVYEMHGDVNIDHRFYEMDAETQIVYPAGAPPELPALEELDQ